MASVATDAYRRFAAQHPSVFLASATYLPPADGAQPEWLLQFAAVDGVRPYDVAVAHHDARVSALGLLGQHQVRQEGELAQAPSIVVPLQDLSLRPSVDLSALAREAMDRAGEEAEYAFSVSGSLEAVGGPEAFRLTVHDHGPSGASRVTVYSGVTGQVLSRSDVCELCGDDA